MICPSCGARNDDRASFCTQCGTRLRGDPDAGDPKAAGPSADFAGTGGHGGPAAPGGANGSGGTGGPRKGGRRRGGRSQGRWRIPLIVVLAIVAVLAVADVVGSIWYSSGDNAVKYSKDAVLYDPQTSDFTITTMDEDAWTITVSDVAELHEGSVLAAGITDETPYGLLRRVTAITPVEGGYLLSTEPAALTDLIDYCGVSSSITLLPDGTYRVDEVQTGSGPFAWVRRAIADDSDPIEQFSWEYEGDADDGLDFELTGGIKFEPKLKIDHGDVDAKFYFRVYARAEVAARGVTTTDIDPIGLYKAAIPLPGVPCVVGALCINLEPELSATILNAGISNEIELNHSFGVQYKDGTLSPYSEDNSNIGGSGLSPEDAAALFGVTGKAEAMLSTSYYLYGIWGPKISVGPHAEATVALEKIDADAHEASQAEAQASGGGTPGDAVQYGEPIRIPGLDADLRGRLNVKVTVPISGVFELNTDSIPDSIRMIVSPLFIFGRTEGGANSTQIMLFDTDDAITLYDSGDITFGAPIDDAVSSEETPDGGAAPTSVASTSDAVVQEQQAWPVGTWVGTTSSGEHELVVFNGDGTFDEWRDGQYLAEPESDGWRPSWYEGTGSGEIVYSYLPPGRSTTGTSFTGTRTGDDSIAIYSEANPDSLVVMLTRASTNRSSADGSGDSVDFDTPYFSVDFPQEWGGWQETIDAEDYTMQGGTTVEHYYFLRSEELGEWVCFVVYDPSSGQTYGQDDTEWVLDKPTSSGLRVAVGFNFESFEDAFGENYSSINNAIGDGTTMK